MTFLKKAININLTTLNVTKNPNVYTWYIHQVYMT